METMNPHIYQKMLEDRFLSAQRDLESYNDRVQLYASKVDAYRVAAEKAGSTQDRPVVKVILAQVWEMKISLPTPPEIPHTPPGTPAQA